MRSAEAELARYLREEFKRQGREIIKFLKKNKVFDVLYDDAAKRWEPYVYEKSEHRPYKETPNAQPPLSLIIRALAGAQAAINNAKKTAKKIFLSKRKAADIGGQTALGNLGINVNFKLQNPKMIDALMQRATKITGVIDRNTVDTVRKTLVREYYQAGEDITRAARALKAEKKLNYLFENTYKNRAMTIARTETRTAQMQVQHETYGRNEVQSKYWIATNDLLTRETHIAAGLQGPIPWNQPYNNGLMYPLDPTGPAEEVINCRCDEGIIRPDTVFCKAEGTEPCTEPWTGGPEPKAGTSSRRLTPRERQMQTVYARPADEGGIGMMEILKLPEREHRVVLKLIERGRNTQARRILARYSGRTVQTVKSMPNSAWKKSRQAFLDCGGA